MPLVHLSVGGPDRTIQVDGVRYRFEMHPYCGPCPLDDDGEPLEEPDAFPKRFWEAVSHWAKNQKTDADGLCIWEWPPEPITTHLGGRHYMVTGYTEPRKGE